MKMSTVTNCSLDSIEVLAFVALISGNGNDNKLLFFIRIEKGVYEKEMTESRDIWMRTIQNQ